MAESQKFYVSCDGGEARGPFTLSEIAVQLDAGELSIHDLYTTPGADSWIPIASLKESLRPLRRHQPAKKVQAFNWIFVVLLSSALALLLLGALFASYRTGAITDVAGVAGSVLLIVFGCALVALGLAVYFLPLIVAVNYQHKNLLALGILNLFLGWTLLGWVGALVWALIKEQRRAAT